MPNRQEILEKLRKEFTPLQLAVTDESAQHAEHIGATPSGGTHFYITIVSHRFSGFSRVARHKMIYATLEKEFKEGMHALAIKALTPEEYEC